MLQTHLYIQEVNESHEESRGKKAAFISWYRLLPTGSSVQEPASRRKTPFDHFFVKNLNLFRFYIQG